MNLFLLGVFIALALVVLGPGRPTPDSEHRARRAEK